MNASSSLELIDYFGNNGPLDSLRTSSPDASFQEEHNSLVIKLSSSLTQVLNDSSSISLDFESNSVTGIESTALDDRHHVREEDLLSWPRVTGAVFCVLLILSTIFGNTLVVIVVAKFHRMRSVTNILLASLAIADITVAVLVMPFLVMFDLIRTWPFGPIACHFWISCDVMCCTASILHLCAVAIDRFWAITRPLRYRSLVNKRRLFTGIITIWLTSAIISFVPIFSGWYHDGSVSDDILAIDQMTDCSLKVNKVYAVVSSMTSFYLPLPVMFYVYFRILLIAKAQVKGIRRLQLSLEQNGHLQGHSLHLESIGAECPSTFHDSPQSPGRCGGGFVSGPSGGPVVQNDAGESVAMKRLSTSTSSGTESKHQDPQARSVERSLRRRSRQLVTDTKAIRTLGIVMGVFCACWLPFFIMYVLSSFCTSSSCELSYEWRSAITWLGYLNSSINPVIYSFTNKDFKTAFRRILCFCTSPAIVIDQVNNYGRTKGNTYTNTFHGIEYEGTSTGSMAFNHLNATQGTTGHSKTTAGQLSVRTAGHSNLRSPSRERSKDKFLNVMFDIPTPSMSRTSSATPEVTPWPTVSPSGQLYLNTNGGSNTANGCDSNKDEQQV